MKISKGICESKSKKPTKCTKNYKPQCGCNNITYSNSCYRNFGEISVGYKSEGSCEKNIIKVQMTVQTKLIEIKKKTSPPVQEKS